jgi:hypothetical protein
MYTVDCHLQVTDQKPCSLRHKYTIAQLSSARSLSLSLSRLVCVASNAFLALGLVVRERCCVVLGIGCSLLLYYSVFANNILKLAVLECKVLFLGSYVCYTCNSSFFLNVIFSY